MTPLLELQNVSFHYPEAAPALRNISLKVNPGERIAVLGNNGAGKSTFFLICNGILRPQSGSLFCRGQEITPTYSKKQLLELRQDVGIVFQDADNQIIASTVESEVSFGPMNLRLPLPEVQQQVDAALAGMNLLTYRDRAPQNLSGGEKKRVSIADILAMRPRIILFDEPSASLDPYNTNLLEQTLNRLSQAGITLLVSTHDIDLACRFADRALVFNAGEIIADGDISTVLNDDKIIEQAGLRKPLLFAAADLLKQTFGLAAVNAPRNLDEFAALLQNLKQTEKQ